MIVVQLSAIWLQAQPVLQEQQVLILMQWLTEQWVYISRITYRSMLRRSLLIQICLRFVLQCYSQVCKLSYSIWVHLSLYGCLCLYIFSLFWISVDNFGLSVCLSVCLSICFIYIYVCAYTCMCACACMYKRSCLCFIHADDIV